MRLISAMPPERAAFIGLAGYMAGFFVMPHELFHLGWLALAGAFQFFRPAQLWTAIRAPVLIPVGIFLVWMVLRSLVGPHLDWSRHGVDVTRGLVGAGLLAVMAVLLKTVASTKIRLTALGPWVVCAAVLAALTAIFGLPGVAQGWQLGQRLSNPLVHGGLNPVVTGLTLAVAAVWCSVLAAQAVDKRLRLAYDAALLVLQLAVFLADCRGALLVMLTGHSVQAFSMGLKSSWRTLVCLLLACAIWLLLATDWSAAAALPSENWLAHHPVTMQMRRVDTGRFGLYQTALGAQTDYLFGEGLWGSRDRWQCGIGDQLNLGHLHSGFFSTFFHGGIVGLLLVLAIVCKGLHSAWRLHQRGDPLWLTLACAGLAGVVFDGESLASLTTAPRFEGMLFWFPLLSAMALVSTYQDKSLDSPAR